MDCSLYLCGFPLMHRQPVFVPGTNACEPSLPKTLHIGKMLRDKAGNPYFLKFSHPWLFPLSQLISSLNLVSHSSTWNVKFISTPTQSWFATCDTGGRRRHNRAHMRQLGCLSAEQIYLNNTNKQLSKTSCTSSKKTGTSTHLQKVKVSPRSAISRWQ